MNGYICCCRIVLTAFMLALCVSSATFVNVSDFGRVEQRRGRYKKIMVLGMTQHRRDPMISSSTRLIS